MTGNPAAPSGSRPTPTRDATSLREWASVIAVALSAFAFVTTEFLPVGLLPQIAADFGIRPGAAGLMVTAPGIIAALSAPGMVLLAGRMDRRYVFLLLTSCLLASNVICAVAHGLSVLLVGRALLGASLGGFWTLATAASTRLVNPKDTARAMAIILAGVTCATVIGVPIGTYIASIASWRAAFASTAALAAVALLGQLMLVPSLPSHVALKVRDLTRVARQPHVSKALLLIPLVFGAHFFSYTYITPFLLGHAHFAMSSVIWLLLGFGIIGFVSNIVLSASITHNLKRTMMLVVTLLLCALLGLPLLSHSHIGVATLLMVWGAAFGGIPLCCSVWMQRATPDDPEAGSALLVCIVQVAIAIGSSVGGAVVDHLGIPANFALASALAFAGLLTLRGANVGAYDAHKALAPEFSKV
ncbi:MFS transporter [Paraburkholderia fungorum]|uniref:MFS transporter n=1 Tax=Paraburkholderia fungorum TaxID=134537 RepID=UPI0038B8477A